MTVDRLYLQKEAAEMLRMSVRQLQRLREAGKIRFLPGRPVKLTETEINAYLERASCLGQTAGSGSSETTGASMKSGGPKAADQSGKARGMRMLLVRRMRSPRGGAA